MWSKPHRKLAMITRDHAKAASKIQDLRRIYTASKPHRKLAMITRSHAKAASEIQDLRRIYTASWFMESSHGYQFELIEKPRKVKMTIEHV